jgi:membrane protein
VDAALAVSHAFGRHLKLGKSTVLPSAFVVILLLAALYLGSSKSSEARTMWNLLVAAYQGWMKHRSPRLGAALAYYAVFSLGPLLLIVVAITGLFFDRETVTKAINTQLSGLIGPNGASALEAMRQGAESTSTGKAASITGVILLLIAAIGVVAQLKDALNTIWEVDERRESGFWPFIRTYLISMAGILALGFLLATSLVLSTVLATVSQFFPESSIIGQLVELVVSFFVLTVLFAALFKYFPDTEVAWSDVWIGGAVTAALFELGKIAISWYIGRQSFESTYGAAASLVVLLIWIYYASQIVLFGAELTRVYAQRRTKPLKG